ncbi:formin-like protein 3 isoform X2 [Iris pallida]|uniref:Formin-like protein 3 isoform X2 n=1 Tax=Iris pallida TaxID=29817 RepID=A0AAX6E4W3_IRIPA|nr:formin-like protein 3 isoform X2 [Iris pallida]
MIIQTTTTKLNEHTPAYLRHLPAVSHCSIASVRPVISMPTPKQRVRPRRCLGRNQPDQPLVFPTPATPHLASWRPCQTRAGRAARPRARLPEPERRRDPGLSPPPRAPHTSLVETPCRRAPLHLLASTRPSPVTSSAEPGLIPFASLAGSRRHRVHESEDSFLSARAPLRCPQLRSPPQLRSSWPPRAGVLPERRAPSIVPHL